MSCTTDNRRPTGRGGSILMEFVIVLPLYLLLLGVAVLLGDFALRSIWLTDGDLLVAYAKGDGSEEVKAAAMRYLWNDLFRMSEEYEYETGGKRPLDMVGSGDDKAVQADAKFEVAWSYQVAGTATDRYVLPPWARGWLGYSEWTYRTQSGGGEKPEGELFGKLLTDDGEGRYAIVSRDLAASGGTRKYGYYTLMRSADGRDGDKPYRRWSPAELSAKAPIAVFGSEWYDKVYGEKFPEAKAEDLEDGEESDAQFPKKNSGRGDYPRGTITGLLSQ